MTRIAGIKVETYLSGEPKNYIFDAKKYGDMLLEFFQSKDIELPYSPYDKKFVAKIKSQEGQKGVKIEIEDLWK